MLSGCIVKTCLIVFVLSQDIGSDKFNELRERNQALFEKVEFSRESYNDIVNVKELAKVVRTQSNKLSTMTAAHDFQRFALELRNEYTPNGGYFNWALFGQQVGACYRFAPGLSSMLGSLEKEVKVRKAIVRNKKDNDEVNITC